MPIQDQSAKNGLENFEGVFIDAAFIDIPTSQTIPLPPTPRKGIVFAGNKTRGDKVTSLSRISNINFSNQFSKELLFSTLDKLNTIYLFGFSEKILNKLS